MTVAAASVAAVTAFAFTSSDGNPPAAAVPSSSGPTGKADTEAGDGKGDNDAAQHEPSVEGAPRDVDLMESYEGPLPPLPMSAPALLGPTPRATGTAPTLRDGTGKRTGQDAGTPAETPAPGIPSATPDVQGPTAPPATPGPEVTPSPTAPQEVPPGCYVGVTVPRLLDLCLAN